VTRIVFTKGAPSAKRRDRRTGKALSVAFLDPSGAEVAQRDAEFILVDGGVAQPAHPAAGAKASPPDKRQLTC
jgi:hypothetical protein